MTPYDAFPTEPIEEVALLFQDATKANSFYGRLLYLRQLNIPEPQNRAAVEAEVANFIAIGSYEYEEKNTAQSIPGKAQAEKPVPISATYHDAEVADARMQRDEMLAAVGSTHVFNLPVMIDLVRVENGKVVERDVKTSEYSDDIQLQIRPEYDEIFRSYDAAMAYIARPVCTLRQYIALRYGMSTDAAVKAGYVVGRNESFYSQSTSKKNGGAVFWSRIYTLEPGPGTGLTTAEQIYNFANCGPAPEYAVRSWNSPGKANMLPQTRQNWDKVLEDYRNTVRAENGFKGAPRR